MKVPISREVAMLKQTDGSRLAFMQPEAPKTLL